MIPVILLTSGRTQYAVRTVKALRQHLTPEPVFFVMDCSRNEKHWQTLRPYLANVGRYLFFLDKTSYGHMANTGWREVQKNGYDWALFLEDDWELCEPLDLSFAGTLMSRSDVSMLRLGHLPVGQAGEAVGIDGRMYLRLFPNDYVFSGNPHLKGTRFFNTYGQYLKGLNPGDTELAMDRGVKAVYQYDILWPLFIGDRFIFQHIGTEKSY
ncbi:MAG: hypothetical protein D6706_21195 [Chloroflexi bacterium]|nr:MAG: hypothetical protein D6706_21195 [Chloroflexota bacterium]